MFPGSWSPAPVPPAPWPPGDSPGQRDGAGSPAEQPIQILIIKFLKNIVIFNTIQRIDYFYKMYLKKSDAMLFSCFLLFF
jgi:hypothetical protein